MKFIRRMVPASILITIAVSAWGRGDNLATSPSHLTGGEHVRPLADPDHTFIENHFSIPNQGLDEGEIRYIGEKAGELFENLSPEQRGRASYYVMGNASQRPFMVLARFPVQGPNGESWHLAVHTGRSTMPLIRNTPEGNQQVYDLPFYSSAGTQRVFRLRINNAGEPRLLEENRDGSANIFPIRRIFRST